MEDLKRELKNEVENWVDRNFNFISLNVYETMADNMLFEYIRSPEITTHEVEEWLYTQDIEELAEEMGEDWKELEDVLGGSNPDYLLEHYRDEIVEYHESSDENYPLWNTLFEWRSEPPQDFIDNGVESGFGVIEGMDDFNTTFFVTGAGYSFYAQHWIPLYLKCIHGAAEKYAGINFSDL